MATIDFLLLANHVEVQNGLLYASGAGWSDLHLHPNPEGELPPHRFAVGTSVLIPWDETNQSHHLTVRVEREEDGTELTRVEGDIEVGRPPGLPVGAEQHVNFAITAEVAFPGQGIYRVVAEVDADARSVRFRVHDQSKQQAPRSAPTI